MIFKPNIAEAKELVPRSKQALALGLKQRLVEEGVG